MPIYDYKCAKCEKIFEVEHRPKAIAMKFCPSCGGELKRVYNAAGIVFKGSGFHSTDYKKAESKKPSEPRSSKS